MRPDTGTFNRLLTSLGLVFLAAALVVPYFYFKNTSVLLIPSKRLEGLTPTARDAIEGRQSGIAHLEVWVIGLAIGLAILGILLVFAGGRRLKEAQESEDEEAELRKARARAEIQGLTPEEEDKKATAEAEEESAEEDGDEDEDGGIRGDSEPSPPSPRSPTSSEQKPPEERSVAAQARPRIAVTKQVILRIEGRFKNAFQSADLGNFEFQPNLRIRSQVGQIEIDGLFTAKSSRRPDVVLELKILNHPGSLRKNIRNRAEQALAVAARFGSIAQEHAPVWLVMVIPEEAEAEVPAGEIQRVEERCRELLLNRGAATIVKEDEIDLLPERFVELLALGRFDAQFA